MSDLSDPSFAGLINQAPCLHRPAGRLSYGFMIIEGVCNTPLHAQYFLTT